MTDKTLMQMSVELDNGCVAYANALRANDAKKLNSIELKMRDIEKDYAEKAEFLKFAELHKEPNPVLAAVKCRSFMVKKHKLTKQDGIVTGIQVSEAEKQIDLVKFCKHCELDTLWQYKVEKLGQLLCLRTATELNMTEGEIAQICKSYYMSDLAKKVNLGDTPTSNTQIVKMLQSIIDEIPGLMIPGENGANTLKVNNHDVAYLLMCYTKRGKEALKVSVAKTQYVHNLLADVIHRITTGKVYGLEYRMEKTPAATTATPVKDEAGKTEQKAEAAKAEKPVKKTKGGKKSSKKPEQKSEPKSEPVTETVLTEEIERPTTTTAQEAVA